MTTNVFDGCAGLLATDSRWSAQFGRWICYIDDTNFEKVEVFKTTAFMFAGKGDLIQEWKNWIRSAPIDDSGQPAVEGISLNGFDIPTKQATYSEGKSITHEKSIFAGSGARYAINCWTVNRDAAKSVESAKMLDPATGGVVKYLDFSSGKSNLSDRFFLPSTIEQVNRELAQKGIFMDITTGQHGAPPFIRSQVSASDASASVSELNELKQKLETGELSANAPCDAMYSEWSPEAKTQLKVFLGGVFGWKN